ncbi:MAG: T9SS type A sorting domain-containing protein [Bacteroidia bacterium]|nr:T9SS type A sorting domain-containing protein [Bacteroidia bacterium]
MMRLFTAFLFFLFVSGCDAQVMFQKTFGGIFNNHSASILQTNDSGFIMAGGWDVTGHSDVVPYLIRTNSAGDTLWTKIYGDSVFTGNARSIEQANDGGFVVTGVIKNPATGDNNILLMKIDGSGNVLWTKLTGVATFNDGYCVKQTNDGGFIVSGISLNGGGYNNICMVRTDSIGTVLFSKVYSDNVSHFYSSSVLPNSDGSFFISGYNNYLAYILIKIDSFGNVLWSKGYDGVAASGIINTNDGNCIISGKRFRPGFTDDDVLLIKINAAGDTLWARTFGTAGNETGVEVRQINDGGFVICGHTAINSTWDALLIKTDSSGNILWSRNYGGINDDIAVSLLQTADTGYAIAGYSNSFGAGMFDAWLIKTNSTGISGCNETSPSYVMSYPSIPIFAGGMIATNPGNAVNSVAMPVSTPFTQQTTLCYINGIEQMNDGENRITIFPNPASSHFAISNEQFAIREISIYDVLGRNVYNTDVTAGNTDVLTINTAAFNSGIYFVSIKTKEGIVTKKLVVQR